VIVLYTSSLAAENTGLSHYAGMLRLLPWRFAQAAGCMTWTHEERQVLPSRLAEEALLQGMSAPHHPNCDNALSERHTSIGGDGLKPPVYLPWDDTAPSSLSMTPTFNPAPSALVSLLTSASLLKLTRCKWVAANSDYGRSSKIRIPWLLLSTVSKSATTSLPYRATHEGAEQTTASNVLLCIQDSEPPCS
jgi:hypothetical protein